MNPEGGSIQELLSVMDSLPVEVEMERTGDGLVEAGLKSTETGDVWRLLFEERKSFNIVLEESLRGDKVRSRIERTFKEREGVWYIDSYVHDSYASIPPDVFPERIEFRIEEIEVNVEVPGETFSYRGFGLPARIHVWDSAKGVDYEAGPGVITARDAEKLPGFTEKGAAEGGEEEGREEGRAETEGSVQVAEGGEAEEEGAQGGASAQWKFRWPVAATAVAALLMLAIAERVVRRRAGRRSSSRRTRYGAIRR